MPTLELGESELYYEIHGDGPAIVFLHGAGGNHLSWWQQVPHFAADHRVITLDHRGFGRSSDAEGAGAERFVADLRALLDHLEVERTALAAQSMGGITALGFAVESPERVTALAMCDTWGFFDWPELARRNAERRGQSGFAALGDAFTRAHPELAFLYTQIMATNPRQGFEALRHGRPAARVAKASVEALDLPTLFIVGSEDALVPPEIIRSVRALVKGSELREFDACGHSVYFESPTEFNATLRVFLSRNRPPERS